MQPIDDEGGGGGGGAGGMTWIPTYGNFGGNGDNDAWSWADRYYGYTVPRTTENVDMVYTALNYFGRQPVDDFDRAYLLHDLGFIAGNVINNVINDIAMGIRVLINLPDLVNADSLAAFLYPPGSIPFISIGASVYHFVTGVIDVAADAAQWVGDAVGSFYNDVSNIFENTFDYVGDLWNGFWGGVNDFFSEVGDFFSDVFGSVVDFFSYLFPVVLDLDGNGVQLVSSEHGVQIDTDNDGFLEHVGWVSPNDGILAIDANGDGVAQLDEISFVASGALTDLTGLAAFDSNADMRLTVDDEQFSNFLVWSDLNGDGVSQSGEAISLQAAGIVAIDLQLNGEAFSSAGNQVHNTTTFQRADGSSGAAWDVAFSAVGGVSVTPAVDPSPSDGNDVPASTAVAGDEMCSGHDQRDLVMSALGGSSVIHIENWTTSDERFEHINLAEDTPENGEVSASIDFIAEFDPTANDAQFSMPEDEIRRLALEATWRHSLILAA